MAVVRAIVAVLVGYALSQGLNGFLVFSWYVQDAAPAIGPRVAMTVAAFLVVGVVSGFLVARIGGEHGGRAALVAGGLVALVTVANVVLDVAAEPLWHKLVVLLLMAPTIAITGLRAARTGEAASGSGAS